MSSILAKPIEAVKTWGGLAGRENLIAEINYITNKQFDYDQIFLCVVNIADTKEYDNCIRIFGYKVADDILAIRLEDMAQIAPEIKFYHVGFWSIAFVFDINDVEDFDAFLDKFAFGLRQPVICRGVPIPIKAGIGVCDIKKGLGAAEDFLQATFLAGQVSSRSGSKWVFCPYSSKEDHRRAFSMVVDIGDSLNHADEFELYYQARTNLQTGAWTGAEALLRWRHAELGIISPGELIPIVEMTGLIRKVTDFVLTQAISQAAIWYKSGRPLVVSVNISPRNLEEADFFARIDALLLHYKLPAKYLELEFSENGVYLDFEAAREKMITLRQLGVNIAIDDFGTGANSLVYLETTPANVMKIGHDLIMTMKDNLRNQSIIRSFISLAHELNMSVVGKGIETTDMLDLMANMKCDYVNGYIFHHPMSAADFTAWCADNYRKTSDQIIGRIR